MVRVVDSIQDEAFIIAQNNELFARVPLNGQLNEDTDAGKSLSLSVFLPTSVYLFVFLCIIHVEAFNIAQKNELIARLSLSRQH